MTREPHEHEWERGEHMAAAFGIDGRRMACAICGTLRNGLPTTDAPQRPAHPALIRKIEALPHPGDWLDRESVLSILRGEV